MSASIGSKKRNVAAEFLKKTAGYITGATGEYIAEVMPVVGSTVSGAKETMQELQSTFANTNSSILPKIRQMNLQQGWRRITSWYLQKENDFSDMGDTDSQLAFDIEVDDPGELAELQTTEWGRNANQISKTVVESSHKMVEAQLSATANLLTSIDKQTAVISSGFDKTNTTLNKILEVLSKNTATLIETTVAANASKSSKEDIFKGGSGFFSEYKKMVKGNLKNSEYGALFSMIPMLFQMGGQATPQDFIKMGIGAGLNKIAPNMKGNMQALDKAVGDVILGSLIRLGENSNNYSFRGQIGKLFGIDANRKDVSTKRSSLELKAVPFDTVTKEAITQAIPGYLSRILVALGGPEVTYNYRSGQFTSRGAARNEFRRMSANTNTLYDSRKSIQNKVGNSKSGRMMYDLLLNEIGATTSGARETLQSSAKLEDAMNKMLRGVNVSEADRKSFLKTMSSLDSFELFDVVNQIGKLNVISNRRMKDYVSQERAYGNNMPVKSTSVALDRDTIQREYGAKSALSDRDPVTQASGVSYTNMALYEIYRRLNEGINVYQVGSAKGAARAKEPYTKLDDSYLTKPAGYRPKMIRPPKLAANERTVFGGGGYDDGSPNELRNQTLEDGSVEDISGGARFARWGKQRGGNLANALFRGNADDVKNAFGLIVRDVTQVGGDAMKKGLTRINDSFGNISGYLKHKLFGTPYEYQSGTDTNSGDAIITKVKENKGIFGFVQESVSNMFKGTKQNASKWFDEVKGFFNFSTPGEKEEEGVEAKRKKLLSTSFGAFAGAGLLGGPFGLLFGALAGNALSATGIGDKIKKTLFGKKEKGDEKDGLVTRAVNSIIDPIKYQVGKSFKKLGDVLKKNIMGPLSDIGAAIKDRITNSANTAFGKVFSIIGKIILAPFKAVTAIAKAPITLLGNLFRGAVGAGGAAAGGAMGLVARMIAGETRYDEKGNAIGGRGMISKRSKDRNALIDNNNASEENIYENYKTWQKHNEKKRSKFWGGMKESTASVEEQVIAESTSTSAEELKKMNKRADRKADAVAAANAAMNTAGIMTSDGDHVDNNEAKDFIGVVDEAAKEEPNKGNIISRIKSLINYKRKKPEEEDKKESLISKLVSGFLSNWKALAGGALAALAIFNKDFRDFAGNLLGGIGNNILTAGANLLDWIKNGKDSKDPNAVYNMVTAPFDIRTDSAVDYINPVADIYHVQTDAAGNDITNVNATRARNRPWQHMVQQVLRRGSSSVAYTAKGDILKSSAKDLASQGLNQRMASGQTMKQALADPSSATSRALDMQRQSTTAYDKAKALKDDPLGRSGRAVGGGISSFGTSLAIGGVAGWGAQKVVNKALTAFGVDENWAEMGGRAAGAAAQIKVTKDAITGKGVAGKVRKLITEKLLPSIGNALNKIFPNAAPKVIGLFESIGNKMTEKILQPLMSKFTGLLTKLGIKDTAVAITGIGIAVMAGAGAIIQACNVENLFRVKPKDADGPMKAIATGLGAVFNLPYVGLVEIIDVVIAPLNGGKGLRQLLAELIYSSIVPDGQSRLEEKQSGMEEELAQYNEKFGTSLDMSTFNDMVNRGTGKRLWTGKTLLDAEGNIQYNEDGSVATSGGLKGVLDKTGVSNVASGIGAGLKEFGSKIKEKASGAFDVGKFAKDLVAGNMKWILTGEQGDVLTVSEDDPNYGLKKSMHAAIGFMGMPIKGLVDVFKGMFKGIKSLVTSIPQGISDAEEDIDKVRSGEMTVFNRDYWSSDAEETENPLGKLAKVFGFTHRLLNIVPAMIGFLGSNMMKGIKNFIGSASSGISDAEEDVNKVKSGEIHIFGKEYWSFNDEEDEPLGKLSKIFGFTHRVLNAVPAMIGYIGSKASEKFKNFDGGSLASIVEAGEKTINDARQGKISVFSREYWKAPDIPEGSSIGGLGVAATYLSKIVNLPSLIVPQIFGGIKNLGKGIWDSFIGLLGKARDYTSEFASEHSGVPLEVGGEGLPTRPGYIDERSWGNMDPQMQRMMSGYTSPAATSQKNIMSNPLGKPFRVTDPYGYSSWRKDNWHSGIDIVPADNSNEAEVMAMIPGKVLDTGQDNIYGNYVDYVTDSGLLIKNWHLKDNSIPSNIRRGANVRAGSILGDMGTTGRSTGPHLHYEINDMQTKSPIDPTSMLGRSIDQSTTYGVGRAQVLSEYYNEEPEEEKSWFDNLISWVSGVGKRFLGLLGLSYKSDEEGKQSWFSTEKSTPSGSYTENLRITDSDLAGVKGPVELLTRAEMEDVKWSGVAELIDLNSKTSYMIHGTGNGVTTHTDYEPVTRDDTEIKRMAAGGKWNWTALPTVLKVNGRLIATSTHSYPHHKKIVTGSNNGLAQGNLDGPPWNGAPNYGGHFCLWYIDSASNLSSDQGYRNSMINAVKLAYVMGNEMFGGSNTAEGFISSDADNAAKIYNFFRGKGLSHEATSAIIGNLQQESGLNPKSMQAGGAGRGRGIAQWEVGGRFEDLEEFARKKGKPWDDLETQLEFLWEELSKNRPYPGQHIGWRMQGLLSDKGSASDRQAWQKALDDRRANALPEGFDAFKRIGDIKQATRLFEATFTRAGNPMIDKRISYANAASNRFYAESVKSDKDVRPPNSTDATVINPGMGGPGLSSGNQKYMKSQPPQMKLSGRRIPTGRVSVGGRGGPSYRPTTSGLGMDDFSYQLNQGSGNLESLFREMLIELREINGNTGNSSDYLDSLNQKEFGVDTGLRTAIGNLGKIKSSSKPSLHNSGNTRSIQSIVKP